MFRRLPESDTATLRFKIDGRPATGRAGESVAAAMLAAGVVTCRTTPIGGQKRAPYCLMGVCFECLVTIDGIGNRQACLIPLTEGMDIRSQDGARDMAGEPVTEAAP
ncbi:(2Fe-2S)-binding protein [Bosea caraganae]|uniref:(2Fe-2S)-binding protein n=1 Tax=Bosea caraganae TaxID=2763117 RepID=A0A370LDX5_9HYPH|nr:(2Fe-2S)-binding protein [Bosea caraganae]RDJ27752.1 (2Fe-2S)-binding protein [Bosea caraganae]RDJ29765.1 (2Fe-2S)-binding protein [Bosea caraganae]